ncbi:MAG: 23S rRNA (uracil(1939)-C(5))-methyltransferase RlmD, partial [Oscillospiraceae bacterium]|nr:23S rRNA (uracil(1939)-C(5))-methyltransferase RlmD [Oscillospiraceae bacterium]
MEYINFEKVPAYDEMTHKGLIRHIYLRKGYHSDEIMLCVVGTSKKVVAFLQNLCTNTDLLTRFSDIKSVVANINPENTNVILGKKNITVHGTDNISDVMCKNKISLSPM